MKSKLRQEFEVWRKARVPSSDFTMNGDAYEWIDVEQDWET